MGDRVPNITSLASLRPTPPEELAHLPQAVQDNLAIRERLAAEFLAHRERARNDPTRTRLGTSKFPELMKDGVVGHDDERTPLPAWAGVLMGTGGKRRLFGPT